MSENDLTDRLRQHPVTHFDAEEAADRIERLQGVVAKCYDLDCWIAEQAGALEVMPSLSTKDFDTPDGTDFRGPNHKDVR